MGCGHSKINIYPRKARSKTNSKKSVTPEKVESEEEEGVEGEVDQPDSLEECDQRKTIRVKPYGGPLLAQTEISSSQQDFFKMLDEKIQNGPDYNSESETERAAEAARLNRLLKDWETASAGSRSLPATPKRKAKEKAVVRAIDTSRPAYQIPQSVIHQSYGVAQVAYRQVASYAPPNPSYPLAAYPSAALQYQAISPMYTSQPTYQPPPPRHYPSYNQHGSPIRAYANSSPKHIPYDQPSPFSPAHKPYGPGTAAVGPPQPSGYSNGEIQFYSHQIQYQQYKDAREQVLAQNQPPVPYRMSPRNYQSSVTIPVVVQNQQNDVLLRKQYELT